MTRRLLAVGGPDYGSGYLPQAMTTNAFGEGEIRRQKGGGRRRYEDDVRPHRNCRGRNRHYYHQSRYANNSDSTAAATTSDSEITVMTSSSKGRQRNRKHSCRRRAYDDTVYKADEECDYKKRKIATDTKNCMRAEKELPLIATTTPALRVRPEAGQSGNYMEHNANYAATKHMPVKGTSIDETAGTTNEMLRFMDTLYRTLGNVAANSTAQTRADNATKAPQITENTRITQQNRQNDSVVPHNASNYEQNYAHFDMQLPQQIVYQTHISHVPTQNACFSTCNKNSVYSQNAAAAQTTCKQQCLQRAQCATTVTQPQRMPPTPQPCAPAPEMRSNCQTSRCIPQRGAFPQYLSTRYSQPPPSAVHSSMPQVCMPGSSRQQVAYTRPPTAVPTQASKQTLPPGMYQSYVEEYVLSRQQQQSAHQGSVTRGSLEKATPRVAAPSQFNTNNTEFSLRKNSRDQSYRTTRQSTEETAHSLEREPHHLSMKPQRGTVSENFDLSADALNKPSVDTTYDTGTTQFKEVRNSVEETAKLNGNVQVYNSSVINSDGLKESNKNGGIHTGVENKMNGSRGSELEETKRRNSKTLQHEASRESRGSEQMKGSRESRGSEQMKGSRESRESAQMKGSRESRESAQMKGSRESKNHQPVEENRKSRKNEAEKANREGKKSQKVGATGESKQNRESKYKKKRDSNSESNTETGTEKEMLRKTASNFKTNSAEKELAVGESKSGGESCDSDYLRECLRRKREKYKNKIKNQRHMDSFSDSDSEEISNGYSGYSSYSRRETRRKQHTASESDDDMTYSLSRTSCKELKKCCSRIVAICRMARDTAGTQTEQWDEGASQRSNKLVDCLHKSIADCLAANPRVMQQIMQLNRDRRRCRVCACGVLDDTGAPVVKDDMILLKFDENAPKLPTRMCMERRSHCTCNCNCKLSDTESEIIREIIRKKRLQEKSKRISALTQNKYDVCDCHSACACVDDEDELEFIENLLSRQRTKRDRERDRTQAQNINEDCVCDCASKAKELAAEIMHEMVKSHIQKIVTDELQHKTRTPPEPENATVSASETITINEQVSEKSVRSKHRAGVCTCCDCVKSPKVRPKAETVKQQVGVCTCDSCGSSLTTPKVRKASPQRYGCTCEADEVRTVVAKSKKPTPQALKCTCDVVENPKSRSKTESIKPQAGVCTCDTDDSPRALPKSERKKTKTSECTCTCDSADSPRAPPKSERPKPQTFEFTCESHNSEIGTSTSERIMPRSGVCTCESDEIPTVTTKSERMKPRMFDCTCDSNESRTLTQTFTRTIELLSGGATKNEMSGMKRQSNGSSEEPKKKRKSAKTHGRNSKRSSKSAEDNKDEYITMRQESMATERKSDASSKDAVRKIGQESRRSTLEAQQESRRSTLATQRESYSDKNIMDPQVNSGSSSGERVDKLAIRNSADEEFVPPSYYKDQMMAQRKITVRSYQAGPTKPTSDELKRCRDDCACRVTPKIASVEEKEYEQKIKAHHPRSIRTIKTKNDLRTCRTDCACKQVIEPVFNDIQEYALSNARNRERTMAPEYKLNDEDNSLSADSVQGSIQKLIIDIKASKLASCTVTGYPKSSKNAERNTQASLEGEAQSLDTDMLMEQRAALCAELTMNELLPQHSLRTLLTKLSTADGKLYATDEFNARPEESLRLAKMNQSKMLNMSSAVKRKLSATTVMSQSLHITGKHSKSDTVPTKLPRKRVSKTRQLNAPNKTSSLAESRKLSQQQHKTAPVINRRDGLTNKFARKSLIPLPVHSHTWRAVKQAKSVSKSSSAEERANTRPLIHQTSDSNHQITRLWPEQTATAAQCLKHEIGHAQMQTKANASNERKVGAKQLTKSQSNIELSYGLSCSTTRPRLESGRHKELPKLSSQESHSSAVPTQKAENIKESLGNTKPENPQFKMVNILSAANQYPTSSSGLSSESCQTNGTQHPNEERCARCRAFYRKTGAHRNLKEQQEHTNARLNYVVQQRTSQTFKPATIHATPKQRRHTARYSITDDEQTDSDIECITVEYSDSEDGYAQYQEELLRKQQLWRKGTVREALEVEERAERARNTQRTTLTGECLERAIHYPTRVWNEERKQLNLQRNGASLFAPV